MNEPMSTTNETIYVLHDQDGRFLGGPFRGAATLDIAALASEFRKERYAEAEADQEDYCWISESGFVEWLIKRGLLTPIDAVSLIPNVDASDEDAYVPKHWPLCPTCKSGRGSPETGRVLHALNRRDSHRKCTECGNTWDHHDEPYYWDRPMLEDDGRCVESGCVPYAISQAGGIPFEQAIGACRDLGWSAERGIDEHLGIAAATKCGLNLIEWEPDTDAETLTLGRLFKSLPVSGKFIVSTRNHWLAYVCGENRDQADTHPRSVVTGCWEVR